MKLLITGFDAFPGVQVNASAKLIEHWRREPPVWNYQTEYAVLPTSYRAVEEQLTALLLMHHPDLVVMMGVHGIGNGIRVERIALNIDDCNYPDVAGEVKQGRRISNTGPVAISTSVDLLALREYMIRRGTEIEISNHAGTYVCNHAYYVALHSIASKHAKCKAIFVHLPSGLESSEPAHMRAHVDGQSIVMQDLVRGLESCI